MSHPNRTEYDREQGDSFPFSGCPSGSNWKGAHLRWLGVDLDENCSIDEFVPRPSILSTNGTVCTFFREHLGRSWAAIVQPPSGIEPQIYRELRRLALKSTSLPQYRSSDRSSDRSSQSPTFSRQILRSDQSSPQPGQHSPQSPNHSPPSNRRPSRSTQQSPHSVLRSPRVTHLDYTTSMDEVMEIEPLPPARGSTGAASPKRFSPKSLSRNSVALSSSSKDSDPNYEPSTSTSDSPGASSDQGSMAEDKSENDVRPLCEAFMNLVEDAFVAAVGNENLDRRVGEPPERTIHIEACPINSRADQVLKITVNGIPIDVLSECKRKNHRKTPDQILGQETCELLAAALQETGFREETPPRAGYYMTYLFSWHHTNCYVSHAKITPNYLTWLREDTNAKAPERLAIKRSPVYNLKIAEDRIRVAGLIAEIACHLLNQYNRAQHLSWRLCNN